MGSLLRQWSASIGTDELKQSISTVHLVRVDQLDNPNMIKYWLPSLGDIIHRYITPAGEPSVAFWRRTCFVIPQKKLL